MPSARLPALAVAAAALLACAPRADPPRLRRALAPAALSAAAGAAAALRAAPAALRAASAAPAAPASSPVRAGIDVLAAGGFRALQGRRVGLVANAASVDAAGRRTIDVIHEAPGVALRALFSPEHGLAGAADAAVPDGVDAPTGLPIHSLYGARRRPSKTALRGLDTIVFDLQDAGARFFTYATTLGYLLEAAAEHRLRVVVLDRPNPLGGLVVEGPVLDPGDTSFIAYHPLPIRHGMTLGELARLYAGERRIGADLVVIPVEGWRRGDAWGATGLRWIPPSPNLRSPAAALLYPGVALLEHTNVSVGRGTDRPFERVGAPWIDGSRLAAALDRRDLPGVSFRATSFSPSASTHAGAACSGVAVEIVDPARVAPVALGLALAAEIRRLFGDAFALHGMATLLGSRRTLDALARGAPLDRIVASWGADQASFRDVRARYLLY